MSKSDVRRVLILMSKSDVRRVLILMSKSDVRRVFILLLLVQLYKTGFRGRIKSSIYLHTHYIARDSFL